MHLDILSQKLTDPSNRLEKAILAEKRGRDTPSPWKGDTIIVLAEFLSA
jgi:hypothetical protein